MWGTGEGSQRSSDHTVPSESPSLVPSTHVLYGHLMGIHTHIHVNKNRVTFLKRDRNDHVGEREDNLGHGSSGTTHSSV